MKEKGFTLLEVLIGIQIWLMVLTFSSFLYKNITTQQKNNASNFKKLMSTQEILTKTKNLPWDQIKSNLDNGIIVTAINVSLKKIKVTTGNIFLETIIFKDS